MFSKAIFLSTRRSLLSFPRLFPCLAIHTYVTPDECILKKDEVYMFTDTGIIFATYLNDQVFVIQTWQLVKVILARKVRLHKGTDTLGDVIHIHHKGRILNTGKPIPENSYEIGMPLTLRIGVG